MASQNLHMMGDLAGLVFGKAIEAILHVLDALAGEGFDAGRVVEHLDRDPAAIVDVGQGLERSARSRDRPCRGRAGWGRWRESGAASLAFSRMSCGIGFVFAGHRLAIEVQAAVRRADHFAELPAGLGRSSESCRPWRPSGSTASVTPHSSSVGIARAQAIGRELHRLLVRHARQQSSAAAASRAPSDGRPDRGRGGPARRCNRPSCAARPRRAS